MIAVIESAFIDDGYEKDGYIARRPGLHPAVSFVFRPMIPTQKARMLADQNRSKNPEEGEVLAAKEIAKRLKWWDVRTREGKELEISAENIVRLQPQVFLGMFLQIIGSQGSDAKPELDNLDDVKGHKELAEDTDAKN